MFYRTIIALGALSLVGFSPMASAGGQTTMTDVKEETLDAVGALKEYAADKKDEAVDQADQLVSELDQRIDRLQARIHRATGEGKQQMRETLASMKQKRAALEARVDAMTESTADAWEQTKQGFIDAFDELQTTYEEAKAEFQG